MPVFYRAQIARLLGVSKFRKCCPRGRKCAKLNLRVQGQPENKNRANGFLVLKGLAFCLKCPPEMGGIFLP